jgi:gliding motility-associated-like protein
MQIVFFFLLLLFSFGIKAQYISRSEPVPYDCPSVCAGGSLMIKIPQVQGFASGTQIQAQLSNAAGNFGAGAIILLTIRHSFNQGSSWINGPFLFSANVNDLFLEVQIPAGLPVGSNYSIRMRASSGYVSNDLFQCNGGNRITLTPSFSPLPMLDDTVWGINRWVAHAYTWTATSSQILNTPALIAQQNFFAKANHKGYFIKNNLGFDINYTLNGSKMPGPLNILHDGTSFSCGEGYSVNYSVRFLRKQFFNPGKYRIDIAADDGIRLSIDGGQTWLLNAFIEQSYSDSYTSTNTAFPGGVCLSGEVKLVVEYFQRPVDARVTVNFTLLSEIAPALNNLTICEGENATFQAGNFLSGGSYQWEYTDSGSGSFTNAANLPPFSGTQSNQLFISPVSDNLNNTIFRCRIDGWCPTPVYTDTALLKVLKDLVITKQPMTAFVCSGDSVRFEIAANANEIFWERSLDNGLNFQPLGEGATYSGTTSSVLSVFPADSAWNNFLFRARLTGCAGMQYSNIVRAEEAEQIGSDVIPNIITPNGDGKNDVFRLNQTGLVTEEILLFDRWGMKIFSSEEAGIFEWNPLLGGTPFSAGVYFYLVKYRINCGKSEEKRGMLSVFY